MVSRVAHLPTPQAAMALLQGDVVSAARGLLGYQLFVTSPQGTCGGIIVETEAYRGSDDPASHAYSGLPTLRTAPMFESAGTVYVYLSYGLHTMLNLVTGVAGSSEAVLIRALEPTTGIDTMVRRRGLSEQRLLTSGPARLTQALGINISDTGTRLGHRIQLAPPIQPVMDITTTTRIGISRGIDLPWRFYITANKYVSKR